MVAKEAGGVGERRELVWTIAVGAASEVSRALMQEVTDNNQICEIAILYCPVADCLIGEGIALVEGELPCELQVGNRSTRQHIATLPDLSRLKGRIPSTIERALARHERFVDPFSRSVSSNASPRNQRIDELLQQLR